MTIVDLNDRAGRRGSEEWVRDPLASDVDNRLVVRIPVEPVERRPARGTWPVPRRGRRLPAGWPIAVAVAGWPLWWALGVTSLVFPLCAIPLAWQAAKRRPVRVPAGFWMWILFLVLVAASGLAIDVDVAGAATSEGVGRYFAFGFRLLNYVAITVMLLYVGNMSEAELPAPTRGQVDLRSGGVGDRARGGVAVPARVRLHHPGVVRPPWCAARRG